MIVELNERLRKMLNLPGLSGANGLPIRVSSTLPEPAIQVIDLAKDDFEPTMGITPGMSDILRKRTVFVSHGVWVGLKKKDADVGKILAEAAKAMKESRRVATTEGD